MERAVRFVFHATGRASGCSCSELELELFPTGLGGVVNHVSVWLLAEAIALLERLDASRNAVAPTVRLAARSSLALQITALRRAIADHGSEEKWVCFYRAEERHLISLLDQRVVDSLRETLQLKFQSDAPARRSRPPTRRRPARAPYPNTS